MTFRAPRMALPPSTAASPSPPSSCSRRVTGQQDRAARTGAHRQSDQHPARWIQPLPCLAVKASPKFLARRAKSLLPRPLLLLHRAGACLFEPLLTPLPDQASEQSAHVDRAWSFLRQGPVRPQPRPSRPLLRSGSGPWFPVMFRSEDSFDYACSTTSWIRSSS